MIRWSLALWFAFLAGCAVIPSERVNDHCSWVQEPQGQSLTPGGAIDQGHLRTDAALAEELAIRYADAHRGFRSGHYAGNEQYARSREQCLSQLVLTIANTHGLQVAQVRAAIRQRSLLADVVTVFLPMAILYWLAADIITRQVGRRFSADEIFARVCAMLLLFAVVSVLGYQLGSMWSFLFEERLRLRTNHLSYRAFFLPWTRHPVVVLLSGAALFWSAVLVRRWRMSSMSSQ